MNELNGFKVHCLARFHHLVAGELKVTHKGVGRSVAFITIYKPIWNNSKKVFKR